MKSLNSLGIEVEYFLQKPTGTYPPTIVNAQKEMEREILGFNINPPYPMGDGGNYLLVSHIHDVRLQTDGTPIEFQSFTDGGSSIGNKLHNLSPYDIHWFLGNFKTQIEKVEKTLLKGYKVNHQCYYQSNPALAYCANFQDAGRVFGSEKTIYNAYDGSEKIQQKKDGDTKVTERTLGLHLHLGFVKKTVTQNRNLTDKIVRSLDSILDDYFQGEGDRGAGYFLREQKFQHKGIYRLKKQESGVVTLEYRQLTPMFLEKNLFTFLCLADKEISRIIKI